MIRKFSWYTRDLSKRRVVLMHDNRAVQLVSITGNNANDTAAVVPVCGGRTTRVPVGELYEPREPHEMYHRRWPMCE